MRFDEATLDNLIREHGLAAVLAMARRGREGQEAELLTMVKRFLAMARCRYGPAVMLAEAGAEADALVARAEGRRRATR